MNQASKSLLPELAIFELQMVEKIQTAEADADGTLVIARRECQELLSQVPAEIREERALVLQAAQVKAEAEAEQIREAARVEAQTMAEKLQAQTGDIVEELIALILVRPSPDAEKRVDSQ